ncbi:MAG TPA: hypothetical protein VK968_00845, partial [Roseimicrobium sp.]|nr:hypothetical protein [Roseimicrobium sp.]
MGKPSRETPREVREGNALPGGCGGMPDGSLIAVVCDECRVWKTETMTGWQPLPKELGELSSTADAGPDEMAGRKLSLRLEQATKHLS